MLKTSETPIISTTANISSNDILIKGARVHNLKNVTVTIPRNKLVVVTGVSGSGKSSLTIDTLFAEGQRRYAESLKAMPIGMKKKNLIFCYKKDFPDFT